MKILTDDQCNIVAAGVNPDMIVGGLGPAPAAGNEQASAPIAGAVVGFFKGLWSDL